VVSLNKLLSLAAPLPLFSAANGHTYLPPSQKPSQPKRPGLSQQTKDDTPMPDNQSTSPTRPLKPAHNHNSTDYESTQLLLDALALSRRHSKDYMDDAPLVGEPGNFRTSKVRDDVAAPPREIPGTDRPLSVPAKEKSPAPAVSSPLPPIQTDVTSQAGAKKSAKSGGERSPTTPGGREKPKRRKSRPAATPTEV
jgi:mediator of RNA polymerase II transcription subunit 6